MLTADLVRVRRRSGVLHLQALAPPGPKGDAERARYEELADRYLAILREHVGRTRDEVDAALDSVTVNARQKKVSLGLRKLALDDCEFDMERGEEAPSLRSELFVEAARRRMEATSQEDFRVEAFVEEAAAERGWEPNELMTALYADLRGEQPLVRAPAISGGQLVARYELGQAQAVLLRATEVRVDLFESHAPTVRHVFHKLKFHGLMHRIESLGARDAGADGGGDADAEGYRITLDGPLSLFRSSTKYGLALALVLPAIRACERYEIEATVLWGKQKDPLTFRLEGGRRGAGTSNASTSDAVEDTTKAEPGERPEVAALVAAFEKKGEGWRAERDGTILHIPGLGVSVPDLAFVHEESGARVYLEVLGFWSRDAVFRRVELAEAGLSAPILFAAPKSLRVSEELLGDEIPASIYIFGTVLSRKAVRERLDALRERAEATEKHV